MKKIISLFFAAIAMFVAGSVSAGGNPPPPLPATPAHAATSPPPASVATSPPLASPPPCPGAPDAAHEYANVTLIFVSLARVDAAAAAGVTAAVAAVTHLTRDDVAIDAVLDYPVDAAVTLRGVAEADWLAKAADVSAASADVEAALAADLRLDAAAVRVNATLGEVELEAAASTQLAGLRRRLTAAAAAASTEAAVVPIVMHRFGASADAAAAAATATTRFLGGGGGGSAFAAAISALGLPVSGLAAASAPRVSATCELRLRAAAGAADAVRALLLAAAASGELAAALQTAGVSVTGVAVVRAYARVVVPANAPADAGTAAAIAATPAATSSSSPPAATAGQPPAGVASEAAVREGRPASSPAAVGGAVGAALGGAVVLAAASYATHRAWRRQRDLAVSPTAAMPRAQMIFDIGEEDEGGAVGPPHGLARVAVRRLNSGRLNAIELGVSPSLRMRTPHAGASPRRQRSQRLNGGSLLAETPRTARGSDGGGDHPRPGTATRRDPRRSDLLLALALDGEEAVGSPTLKRRSRRFSTPTAHPLLDAVDDEN